MNERTITVKGKGNITAKPDSIIITMEIENTDYSYNGVMQRAISAIDAIKTSLVSIGYEKDALKTTNFSIDTDYERYEDSRGNWKRKFNGYKCTHHLKIEFDFDTEKLNKILSAITASGTNPEFNILFSVKDKEAVSEELLQNAVTDASRKAAILAAAAGVSLGKIQRIDYDWNEVHFFSETKMLAPMDYAASSEQALEIEPEDIHANDTVTVIWSIE